MSNCVNLLADSYISFVNLDHRKDRLAMTLAVLDRVGIKAVRTPGMLPPEATAYAGDPKKVQVMKNRTPGAIGCHYSQVKIMKRALEEWKHAWVMEDDLVFCVDFMERLHYMETFLTERAWDVLWLGATFHVNPPWWHKQGLGRDALCTDDPRMMRTYGAFCTYAYIVNRESLSKVLQLLDEIVHLSMGIDWAFIQLQPNLFTYAFVPGSIVQYDNMSDIGKGMTRFSGFSKLGPYWFQQRMTDFDPTKFNWHEARV